MPNETMNDFVEKWLQALLRSLHIEAVTFAAEKESAKNSIRDLCRAHTARHKAMIETNAYVYCEGRETYEDAHNEGVDAAIRALEEDKR